MANFLIQPLHDQVLVEIVFSTFSNEQILLTTDNGRKNLFHQAKVILASKQIENKLQPNQLVLIKDYVGIDLTINHKKHKILAYSDILAIVSET